MMRQALVALGPKSVVAGVLVGGAALALGALFLPHAAASPPSGMYRLVLHAPEEHDAFYVSAWEEGDVFVPANDQKSITFVRRGEEHDGCTWQGTEKLTRIHPRVYAYDYSEAVLACQPGAPFRSYRKTPRTGIVTAESWSGPATATAAMGILPPGNDGMDTVVADEDGDDGSMDDEDLDDAEQALADARREIADAQREIEDAVRQANEEVKAALAADDDE